MARATTKAILWGIACLPLFFIVLLLVTDVAVIGQHFYGAQPVVIGPFLNDVWPRSMLQALATYVILAVATSKWFHGVLGSLPMLFFTAMLLSCADMSGNSFTYLHSPTDWPEYIAECDGQGIRIEEVLPRLRSPLKLYFSHKPPIREVDDKTIENILNYKAVWAYRYSGSPADHHVEIRSVNPFSQVSLGSTDGFDVEFNACTAELVNVIEWTLGDQ